MIENENAAAQSEEINLREDFMYLLYAHVEKVFNDEKQTGQDREILPVCLTCLTELLKAEFDADTKYGLR